MPDWRRWGKRIVGHPGSKLVALLLAVFIWLRVQALESQTALVQAELRFDLPSDLLSVDPLLGTVQLSVSGPRAAVRRAQTATPRIHVDLTDRGIGEHEVALGAQPVEDLPGALAVISLNPELVRVVLDERVRRTLRVRPVLLGDLAKDHAVMEVVVDPPQAEVEGPAEVIAALEDVGTVPVDIGGWSEDQQVDLRLDPPRGVRPAQPWSGVGTITIDSLRTELTVSDVPVQVWHHRDWWPVEGQELITVVLEGPTKVLRSLRTDRVVAKVEIPADTDATQLQARFRSARGARFEILHPRDDVVTVARPPADIQLERR